MRKFTRILIIFILIGVSLLLLIGCSSAPITDQGRILPAISDVNKAFPQETWLHLKINYADAGQTLLVLRKGGCGYIEKFNMNLCYQDNILTVDSVKIYASPLWRDGFIYHLPNEDITIRQISSAQSQENLW